MKTRHYFITLWLLCLCFFLPTNKVNAQATFKFVSVKDTIDEGNAGLKVATIVANSPSATALSVIISLTGGTANASDFNNQVNIFVNIPANADSFAFLVPIYDDYVPEFLEYATWVLRSNAAGATIDADSTISFFIKDNDLPATLGFIKKSDTIFENQTLYTTQVVCNNPNPNPVSVFTKTDDANSTLNGGGEFTYFWQTLTFQPGLDTITVQINLFDDFIQEPTENVQIKLTELNANVVPDSLFNLLVLDDESPQPIFVSYIPQRDTVWEDTVTSIAVYVEIFNPLPFTYNIQLVQDNARSTASGTDFYFNNPYVTVPPGYTYDTVFILVKNDRFVEGTETIILTSKFHGGNLSADSTFTLYILDTDTVEIGFAGAAFSFLESDGRCKVKLTTSSPMPYDITVPVTYLDGNATRDVDFIFNDTLVVFPANSLDTQAVYINLIDDNIKEVNEQVVLQIGSLSDATAKRSVLEFTLFIIDNDTLVLSMDDLAHDKSISIYPNPFGSVLSITTEANIEAIHVFTLDGKMVLSLENMYNTNVIVESNSWQNGMYVMEVQTTMGVFRKKLLKQ